MQVGISAAQSAARSGFNVEERRDLSGQVEAMPAEQAVVICQYMAIQFFAELGANGTATYTATESAKQDARECADGDAERSGKRADSSAYLTTREYGTRSSCSTAYGANTGTECRCFYNAL